MSLWRARLAGATRTWAWPSNNRLVTAPPAPPAPPACTSLRWRSASARRRRTRRSASPRRARSEARLSELSAAQHALHDDFTSSSRSFLFQPRQEGIGYWYITMTPSGPFVAHSPTTYHNHLFTNIYHDSFSHGTTGLRHILLDDNYLVLCIFCCHLRRLSVALKINTLRTCTHIA